MLCRLARLVIADAVCLSAIVALSCGTAAWTQSSRTQSDALSLQDLHSSALRLQEAGDLDKAAGQYKLFLAAALNELGNSRARAGQYATAVPLFDEALSLGSSPLIRGSYATAALQAGDLNRAESLARELVNEPAVDSKQSTAAHRLLGRVLHKTNHDQDARKELEAAVALDPSSDNHYDLAVICLDLDDEQCAIHNFDQIESSTQDSPDLHMQIGLAYGNSDFTPRAVAEFKKVIAKDPRYPQAHYCVAAALLAAGEDEKTLLEAEVQLKEELKISPNDFLTYAALGKIEAGYRRYTEAEEYLKRAIALNPNNPDAFLYLGQMYFDTDRLALAQPNLRQAIKLTTDPSRNHYQIQKAHFLLGRILMQQHREHEAHEEMQLSRALSEHALIKDRNKLSGMLPEGARNTGRSGATSDSAVTLPAHSQHVDPQTLKSEQKFEKQLIPPIADSYNNLGAITASQNRFTEALLYFKRAAAWNPSLEGLDYNIGHAAFLDSNFSEAIPPLRRYIRSHPTDSGIRAALAMSEFKVQNYTACIALLKAADDNIRSIPQMQYIYAESLVKTGQLSAGTQRLQALRAAHPEIAEVHRSLGEIAALRQDWQQAFQELNEANRLQPNDPETHFDLGKAALNIGNTGNAIQELEQAIHLSPDNPAFHQELASAYERTFRFSDAEKEKRVTEQLKTLQSSAAQQAGAVHAKSSVTKK